LAGAPIIDNPTRQPEPSIINDKTIADFTRVVVQTGILEQRGAPRVKKSASYYVIKRIRPLLPA
jgi:hypothetical protein